MKGTIQEIAAKIAEEIDKASRKTKEDLYMVHIYLQSYSDGPNSNGRYHEIQTDKSYGASSKALQIVNAAIRKVDKNQTIYFTDQPEGDTDESFKKALDEEIGKRI